MLTKYIVERDLASAPSHPSDDAASVIARARRLFSGVGTGIVWVESFVAGRASVTPMFDEWQAQRRPSHVGNEPVLRL